MWYCHQLGSREHYSIPRSLHAVGKLELLQTDCWVTPGLGTIAKQFGLPSLAYRYHSDLANATVHSFTAQRLLFDLNVKLKRIKVWTAIMQRNEWFQTNTERTLRKMNSDSQRCVVFSYSYTARRLFQWAKKNGHLCVLGQVDPGPEEFRWVRTQTRGLSSSEIDQDLEPPPEYWEHWEQEVELADCILVNSEWSKILLERAGVRIKKLKVVPLAFERSLSQKNCLPKNYPKAFTLQRPLKVLFLGQVIRRKGVVPLLEATEKLISDPIEFTIAGPDSEGLLSAHKKHSNIRALGSVDKGTAEKLYKESDVFILPTFSDGFAITQLEAAAYRLPLIVSKYCGQVVETGKNGWILSEIKADTIIETLRMCLLNPTILTNFSRYESDWQRFSLKSLAQSLEEAEKQAHTYAVSRSSFS